MAATADWLATAKQNADLSRAVSELAARLANGTTRGSHDAEQLWAIVRQARNLGPAKPLLLPGETA